MPARSSSMATDPSPQPIELHKFPWTRCTRGGCSVSSFATAVPLPTRVGQGFAKKNSGGKKGSGQVGGLGAVARARRGSPPDRIQILFIIFIPPLLTTISCGGGRLRMCVAQRRHGDQMMKKYIFSFFDELFCKGAPSNLISGFVSFGFDVHCVSGLGPVV